MTPDVCLARTGFSSCVHPDRAHHCRLDADHAEPGGGRSANAGDRVIHECACCYRWTCLTGSIDELHALYTAGGVR
jgi:hypothetical protein